MHTPSHTLWSSLIGGLLGCSLLVAGSVTLAAQPAKPGVVGAPGRGAKSKFLTAHPLTGQAGAGYCYIDVPHVHDYSPDKPVLYQRVPRLTEALRIAHADGSFGKLLAQLARIDVLILDDWGMTPLDQAARHDLLEVIDDRATSKSTIITNQLPIDHWHAWLNDPTVADAILDRLVHRSHRIALKGESMRKKPSDKSKSSDPS